MERERTGLKGFAPILLLLVVAIALFVVAPTKAYADPGGVGYTIAQTFPDTAMASAVEAQLGATSTAYVITADDVANSTSWNLYGQGIVSIEGIEYFTNLDYLALQYNQISDVGPLSGLTDLTMLYLSHNQISDVGPLSGLTKLTLLDIDSNQLVDIGPLSGLTKLTSLDLDTNQIVDINPFSGLTDLTSLVLDTNKIVDVGPLSGLTKLTVLRISDNEIVDVGPLSGLTKLTQLMLESNHIVDIGPLSGLTDLTSLSLYRNEIVDVGPLSGLTKLAQLTLTNNQISDISPLSGLAKLTHIAVGNQVVTLPDATGAPDGSFNLKNPIINVDGSSVAVDPSAITSSGTYASPTLSWTGLPIGKTTLVFSVPTVQILMGGKSIGNFSAQVSETITIPLPTVSYDGKGSDGGSLPTAAAYAIGATVPVDFTVLPTRAGYTFSGWGDGTTTYISDGTTSFTMPAGDVTLFATWTQNAAAWTQDTAADNGSSSSTPEVSSSDTSEATSSVSPNTGDSLDAITAAAGTGLLGMAMVGLSFFRRKKDN